MSPRTATLFVLLTAAMDAPVLADARQMWRQDATDPNRTRWVGNGGDYRIPVERSDARTARLRVLGDQNTYAMRRIYPR